MANAPSRSSSIGLDPHPHVIAGVPLVTALIPKGSLVAELIPVLVDERGRVIFQSNLENAELLERVQFVRLADAVVVRVDPNPQMGVHGIARVDKPIAIAAVRRVVENGQSQVAVWGVTRRLSCQVAEKFREVVNRSVAVPVQCQPAISPICVRPAHLLQGPPGEQTKFNALIQTGQMVSFVESVEYNGATTH
jgi:hypothetical protein